MTDPRLTHIRSGIRILFFVPAGAMLLLMPGCALTLDGFVKLLTDETAQGLRSLGVGLVMLYALFRLVRWAVRPIPVNADGTVGRFVRVQYPELVRHDALEAADLQPTDAPAEAAEAPLVLSPDPGNAPPRVLLAVGLVWLSAGAVMMGLAAAMSAPAPLEPGFLAAALTLVLVPGFGALLAFHIKGRRLRAWGKCRLELPHGPGALGAPLSARVVLPHPPGAIREVRATLRHLIQMPRRRPGGPSIYAEGWQEGHALEARTHPEGAVVEFLYHLPSEGRPSSRTRGSGASLWQLEVSTHEPPASRRTLPGSLHFIVPVVRRAEDPPE